PGDIGGFAPCSGFLQGSEVVRRQDRAGPTPQHVEYYHRYDQLHHVCGRTATSSGRAWVLSSPRRGGWWGSPPARGEDRDRDGTRPRRRHRTSADHVARG